MNTQRDEIAAIELENTPRWVADHLMRLCDRIEALETALTKAMAGTKERTDRLDAIEAFLMADA